MSERIPCPSCGAGLILPESIQGSVASCPRCLAAITIPEAVREPGAIRTERPTRREAPLGGRERDVYDRTDLDVRRDTQGTSCFVIGLAVVGALGILFTGWATLGSAAANSDLAPVVYFVVALLFLAGLSMLIVFVRSGGNPGASGFRRVVVGTLALAGAGALTITLACAALIAYLFVVCSSTFR